MSSGSLPPLPFSDRPVSSAPGHWVLARAGKRVLRPGGAALSRAMLDRAGLTGADVVEFAPGLGRTAAQIIAATPASYTGVDEDPKAAALVERIVAPLGRCLRADARDTGLDAACADVVVGEAMLTMQGERGKNAIVSEAARILRPGGRYVIHELAVTPDDIDEEVHTEIRQALARAIHVNARPMTVKAWTRLLEDHGFTVEWSATAPMALLKLRRNLQDEGWRGVATIIRNVARDKELRTRILSMARTFKRYEKNMCGVALVARKTGKA